MPVSEVPVHIKVWAPFRPPAEKLHLPLEFGFQLLPWTGRVWEGSEWEGIVKVDRTDPYQFTLVPPKHILRLPIEYIPNSDTKYIYNLESYRLEPDPIAEVEV